MDGDRTEPLEDFESWLLCLVTRAVEADEVSEALLMELQAEIEAAKERPENEGHAAGRLIRQP